VLPDAQLRTGPAPQIPAQQIDPSGAASTPYPWPTENVRIGGYVRVDRNQRLMTIGDDRSWA
jgi:hypothetical protein